MGEPIDPPKTTQNEDQYDYVYSGAGHHDQSAYQFVQESDYYQQPQYDDSGYRRNTQQIQTSMTPR